MKKRLSHTIASVISDLAPRFEQANLYYGHGTDNAYDEAAWLVLHQMGKSLQVDCDSTELVTSEQYELIRKIADVRISTHKPLAYLINSSWFCGLEFYIDERALIPRSPIAELIFNQFSPWLDLEEKPMILDMCTGSACIAIALASYIKGSNVDACDISKEALEVAEINIKKHGMSEKISLFESDIFKGLPGNKYDLIVCNPPYVDKYDMDNLPSEYLHEPALALESGETGLDFVSIFMESVSDFLKPNGGIVLEVGNSEEALQNAFPTAPFLWFEFEQGGYGVFLITRDQLIQHQALFL